MSIEKFKKPEVIKNGNLNLNSLGINKDTVYQTPTGSLISQHDFNFLPEHRKAVCKIYPTNPQVTVKSMSELAIEQVDITIEEVKALLHAILNSQTEVIDGAIRKEVVSVQAIRTAFDEYFGVKEEIHF
ncbi:MAG TPA: hypothetical protein VF622_11780 [Segetibacter sp.]|jgi:hypothetical protein